MTPNWDFLLNESLLASVLPPEFAQFARPVRDGLSVFLSGLPDVQQNEMLTVQLQLAADTEFPQRLAVLARSSPILQKLGQVLARDQRLPQALRDSLQELESLPPMVPLETIAATLSAELGPLENHGIELQPPAIAEASVAVVIPFRMLGAAHAADHVDGVFKVLKPGIEQQLRAELQLLEEVGRHLDNRCEELQIPRVGYEQTFQQVHDKLLDEVQLRNEQRHLVQAAEFYRDARYVQIPRLLPFCTSRVTAMERVDGVKVTDHRLQDPHQKRRLARRIVRALLAEPLFSVAERPLFHGDPHAGNLFLARDGRVAILDWSLAGRLGARERIAVVQMVLAALTLDDRRLATVLAQLSVRQQPDPSALQQVAQEWVRRVRRGSFPGMSWLVGMLDDAVKRAGVQVCAELMLFRKTLLVLEGVCAEVGESEGLISRTLMVEFLKHFAIEWPSRWIRSPTSRRFSTRLSSVDLASTVFNAPATLSRFWSEQTIELAERCLAKWEQALRPGPTKTA